MNPMATPYTYLLSLLLSLLITNWVNSASLRTFLHSSSKWSVDRRNSSFVFNDDQITLEPVLSRRRPVLSALERRKRWLKEDDNDEVEIPIDESVAEQLTTSSITTIDNVTIVSINSTEDIFSSNSTMTNEQSDMNSLEVNVTENFDTTSLMSEVNYPFLRKDTAESDSVANISVNEDVTPSNRSDDELSTESNDSLTTINDIIPLTTSVETIDFSSTQSASSSMNATDINQVLSNDKNDSTIDLIDNSMTMTMKSMDDLTTIKPTEDLMTLKSIKYLSTMQSIGNEIETSTMVSSINQTAEEISTLSSAEVSTMSQDDNNTAVTHLDQTTISSEENNDNQTLIDSVTTIVSEYNTTIINESINTTITSDTSQYDTTSITEGIKNITMMQNTVDNISIVTVQTLNDLMTSSELAVDDTTVTSHELSETSTMGDEVQNDTTIITNDDDEYSNDTLTSSPRTATQPVCDRACQCARECRYGFEIVNNECQCDPPCKNYQCFGDDKCIVTDTGEPSCRPEDGSEHDRPLRCYQPRDEGYHDAIIQYHSRWYYDPNQNTCHLFVYRGLGGNENNFATLHGCNLECITCAAAPDPGPCYGRIQMWYYDHKQNQCSQFDYSGCKGNDNKFMRKKLCVDTCITRILNF